jgi:glycosyltransferase involved in cell wall biosynthesis
MRIFEQKKIKVLRVITHAIVIQWHLKNFIDRSAVDYDLYITGENVTKYKDEYPHVTFIDNQINRKLSPWDDFKALIRLIKLCRQINPDIIHSIMPKAGLLASVAGLVAGVPIRVHTFTGQIWATMSGLPRFLFRQIDKLILSLCTTCLTDSKSQSEFLKQYGLTKKAQPIPYLGNGSLSGVCLQRFNINLLNERDALRLELGIKPHEFVFVFLARKSRVKGIKELFEAFDKIHQLPDVKLLFIGPDESKGYLQQLYHKYELWSHKIVSLDTVTYHEKYIALSDVLCLPSSSEGFGTIVIEAAALTVPSIGFDIVGLRDAIEDNVTGILVPAGDVNKFSDAMIKLYDDENLLKTMKQKARERAIEFFSADTIYKKQHLFYASLLNGS